MGVEEKSNREEEEEEEERKGKHMLGSWSYASSSPWVLARVFFFPHLLLDLFKPRKGTLFVWIHTCRKSPIRNPTNRRPKERKGVKKHEPFWHIPHLLLHNQTDHIHCMGRAILKAWMAVAQFRFLSTFFTTIK